MYLIFNTVFNLVQASNAFWLVFELPVYLDWFKLTRVYSLEAAIAYNLVYAWFAYKLYVSVWLYDFETMGTPTTFEVFKDMYLVYNLILHSFILPINLVIIVKEIEVALYKVLDDQLSGTFPEEFGGEGEYSINEQDVFRGWNDFWWVLNPLNWIETFWYFFFGFPLWDLFEELDKL